MLFKNREHAALLLAEKLNHHKGKNSLVLGIPNGGIPMAKRITEALGGEMDAVLVEKISPPGEPKITMGAVDEAGRVYISLLATQLGLSENILKREKKQREKKLSEIRKRLKKRTHPFRRTVIVVDDGTATNVAMIAALRSVRNKQPKHLVAATIMTPKESLDVIRELADEVISLMAPKNPYAVTDLFIDFKSVPDEEVFEIMNQPGSGAERNRKIS